MKQELTDVKKSKEQLEVKCSQLEELAMKNWPNQDTSELNESSLPGSINESSRIFKKQEDIRFDIDNMDAEEPSIERFPLNKKITEELGTCFGNIHPNEKLCFLHMIQEWAEQRI